MLLFNNQRKGLKLALVEELEAHLHPQYQLRLIEYISSQQNNEQFILSTHSITLASKIRLANLIVLKGNDAFPMSSEYTKMLPADYRFLERFLDATKANLFFAKGLIMVEGDAENLLIPAIAKLIGKDLYQYGVSVVNVGSTAYKRYINIFKRKDGKSLGMPISVISDLDVRALEYYDENSKDRKKPRYWLKDDLRSELENISTEVDYDAMSTVFGSISAFEEEVRLHKNANFRPIGETIDHMKAILKEDKRVVLDEGILARIREEKRMRLGNAINTDEIKIFLPQSWTLEYEIAGSNLYRLLATAIKAAQMEKEHPELEMSDKILNQLWNNVTDDFPDGGIPTKEEAYNIFKPLNDGTVSKAITAQYLAGMLAGELAPVSDETVNRDEVKSVIESDDKLKYLVDAIKHVTK